MLINYYSAEQTILYRAVNPLAALLDYSPVVIFQQDKVVANQGDMHLLLRKALLPRDRTRKEFRRSFAPQERRRIGKNVIYEGPRAEIKRERHMRAVCDWLAETPVREQAVGVIVCADEDADVRFRILKEAFNHTLEEAGLPSAIGIRSMNSTRNQATYCVRDPELRA